MDCYNPRIKQFSVTNFIVFLLYLRGKQYLEYQIFLNDFLSPQIKNNNFFSFQHGWGKAPKFCV